MQANSTGPLAGLRVLDVGVMLAGPYAATLLGDMGADVIKIESHHGDEGRHFGMQRGGESGAYISVNRSKRGIVLDLRKPAAKEVFGRLAATADILITNVREPGLTKFGINYEQVKAHKPDIIWVGVTAFGADGPYAGRPGVDFLAQVVRDPGSGESLLALRLGFVFPQRSARASADHGRGDGSVTGSF